MKYDWRQHPWALTGMVEELGVDFLIGIANPTPSQNTDNAEGKICSARNVWESIQEEGMRDPLLIVLNIQNNTIRLESGNHRIREAKADGVKTLPVATFVMPTSIYAFCNGNHTFSASQQNIDLSTLLVQPYPYQIRLSDLVHTDARAL